MPLIDFYLLPIISFDEINAQMIFDFDKTIKAIEKNGDNIYIPDEFYSICDKNGITFWNTNKGKSEQKLLINLIAKRKNKNVPYNYITQQANDKFTIRFVRIGCNCSELNELYITNDYFSLINVYRHCAKDLSNFSELYEWRSRCYPLLLFTEDAFGSRNQAFGNYKLLFEETNHCLSCLNDNWEILKGISDNNERLQQLSAKGLNCSGKGNNEKHKFTKNVKLIKEEKIVGNYIISCVPHFKLVRGNSDYRIYFSWGKQEIRNFSFIIVHAGSHWEDKKNSVESEIILDS